MIYSVHSRPPAPPVQFPFEVEFYGTYGHRQSATLRDERDFYAWRFWHWGCTPMGQSLIGNEPKSYGEDSGLVNTKNNQ